MKKITYLLLLLCIVLTTSCRKKYTITKGIENKDFVGEWRTRRVVGQRWGRQKIIIKKNGNSVSRVDEDGYRGTKILTRGIVSQKGDVLTLEHNNSYKITFFIVKPPYELDTTIYAGGNTEHYTIATELKFEGHKDIDTVDYVWFKIK